jgi:hypothetical protein
MLQREGEQVTHRYNDSSRIHAIRQARSWQRRVMAAVGTWWHGESTGVPAARTLHYGEIHSRGEKAPVRRFATFGDAPESNGEDEVSTYVITGEVNDGFELWFGTRHRWDFQMDEAQVRMLLRYLILEWYGRALWFGLRRPIYYRALRSQVSRYTDRSAA